MQAVDLAAELALVLSPTVRPHLSVHFLGFADENDTGAYRHCICSSSGSTGGVGMRMPG